MVLGRKETKIFDPADWLDPSIEVVEISDPSVVKRGDQWWMYAAGQVGGDGATELFSASLPPGAALSATGWSLTRDRNDPRQPALLAGHRFSESWDSKGGRHCPSYVKGWDPQSGRWVERIYYAGSAEELWGPYTIGYLEWDGIQWIDQAAPVFVAAKDWERGSVYEPNVMYADGKWKMWYVAGSNMGDYIVHGFSESVDGVTNWSEHKVFAPAEEKVFDFCVFQGVSGYEAVFSRVWLASGKAPSQTGLWWCRADAPGSDRSNWSEPVQIMSAEDRGWHVGPWKPSLQYDGGNSMEMFVFFSGCYRTSAAGGFPFSFTMGCLEIGRPEGVAEAPNQG